MKLLHIKDECCPECGSTIVVKEGCTNDIQRLIDTSLSAEKDGESKV